ncbi:MAG: hypothetical protein AB1486_11005 [Planctomycetota bacterium]
MAHARAGYFPYLWLQSSFEDPSPNNDQRFGWAVARATRIGTALDDIIVGVPHSDIPGTTNTGEAFVWNY